MASRYSAVDDARRQLVFPVVRQLVQDARALLDYGGGDGLFTVDCAVLPIQSLTVFDPAPQMLALARAHCEGIDKVRVCASTDVLNPGSFDAIAMNAVWMCLPTERACVGVLQDIGRLLEPSGVLVASVTHPCFRDVRFSTFHAEFDRANYLRDGTPFSVSIFDGARTVEVTDTHWSLGAMTNQLHHAGFVVDQLIEVADAASAPPSWLIVKARRRE
jgi:SAM-dependent methyltransferase